MLIYCYLFSDTISKLSAAQEQTTKDGDENGGDKCTTALRKLLPSNRWLPGNQHPDKW